MNLGTSYFAMQPAVGAQSMSDSDGVNRLIMMSDDPVRQAVGTAFVAQMQHSGRVAKTFFPSPAALLAPLPVSLDDWTGQVASSLIALSLAQCSSHGFASTVSGPQAQAFLQSSLTPNSATFNQLATANYQALFPSYCASEGISFGSFQNGTYGPAARWGSLLADHLVSTAYINPQMIKLNAAVDPQGWFQIFFANVYKVQCLDATQVQRVLDTWDRQLGGKEVPGKQIPWMIYDHMVAATFTMSTFMSQVQTAINRSQKHSKNHREPGTGEVWTESWTTYGDAVNDWLSKYKGLGGFIVGPSSKNRESGGGGGCCFVPGTPILLPDGSTRPIEAVAAGEVVRCRNGETRPRSAQEVHWHAPQGSVIYGINDYPPFFTASHPFRTTTGWRSIHPASTRQLSRTLEVEELRVGDVLLQAEGGDPLRYREVPIRRITRQVVAEPAGQDIYSLHLESENPGYHAHGFLVAVNYPELREDDFVRAFSGISDGERLYLHEHFAALAPFLRRGLGEYVSEILRRALGPRRASTERSEAVQPPPG